MFSGFPIFGIGKKVEQWLTVFPSLLCAREFTLNKYKTFSVLIYIIQLYQREWKLGKRGIVWKHDARRAEYFHTISSFAISTSVDITVYQHGKNVLYLFYNIAQRNI